MARPPGFEPYMDVSGITVVKRTISIQVAYQPTAFYFEKIYSHFGTADEIQAVRNFVAANPMPTIPFDPVTGNPKIGNYTGWLLSGGSGGSFRWYNRRSFILPKINDVGGNLIV